MPRPTDPVGSPLSEPAPLRRSGSPASREGLLRTVRRAAVEDLRTAFGAGRQSRALHVLVLLLLPVPFLLVAHQLYFWDVRPFASPRWAVNADRSYIEIFGYAQSAAAALLLSFLAVRRRASAVYAGWALTLATIVLDDSLRWHERGGSWLVRQGVVGDALGLPAQALAEQVVWGLLAVPLLLLLALTHRTSAVGARRDSWRLAALTALLAFFAVVIDIVHEVVEELTDNGVVDLLMTFLESGGEVAAMTALLAFAVHRARRRWPAPVTSGA